LGWLAAPAVCGSAVLAAHRLSVGRWLCPLLGEEATGGACVIGGLLGGIGIGFGAQKVGESAGGGAYDFIAKLSWDNKG
jgi:hypothetical protein